MELELRTFTKDRISDVLDFERRLRGGIDASLIASRFDGSKKAYLEWICVIKSSRHQGVAQRFYKSVPDSVMRNVGIWITIK